MNTISIICLIHSLSKRTSRPCSLVDAKFAFSNPNVARSYLEANGHLEYVATDSIIDTYIVDDEYDVPRMVQELRRRHISENLIVDAVLAKMTRRHRLGLAD